MPVSQPWDSLFPLKRGELCRSVCLRRPRWARICTQAAAASTMAGAGLLRVCLLLVRLSPALEPVLTATDQVASRGAGRRGGQGLSEGLLP